MSMGMMSYDRFDAKLAAAASGTNADEALTALLRDTSLNAWQQTKVVAALGDTEGPEGSAALREAFGAAMEAYNTASKTNRAGQRDLLCACVFALARRDDAATATDIYLAAAQSSNWIIRDYGLRALAQVGDERAWEEIRDLLDKTLQRKMRSDERRAGDATSAIVYLARHAPQGSARASRLIDLLRSRWQNIANPQMYSSWWAGIEPPGLPPDEINLAAFDAARLWQRT